MKDAPTPLEPFALEQVAMRLGRLAFEVGRARNKADADAVHDLRVSIRRLTQALRVFEELLPSSQAGKVRKRLRPLMEAAAEVRNLDIADDLLKNSGIPGADKLRDTLADERRAAARRLKDALRRLHASKFSNRWRERLCLHSQESQ